LFIYRQSKLLKRASLVIAIVGFILLVTGAATSSTTDPLFIIGICMLLFGILFGAYMLYRTRGKEAVTIKQGVGMDTKEIPEIDTPLGLKTPGIQEIPIGSLAPENNDPSIYEILGMIPSSHGYNISRRSIITVDGNATVYKVTNDWNPDTQWFMVYKKSDHDNFDMVDQAIRNGALIWSTAVHNVTLRDCEWIVHKLKRCSGTLEDYIYSKIQDQFHIFKAITTFIENIVATTTRCTIVDKNDIGYFANNQLGYNLMLLRVETLHNTTPYDKKNLFEWFITEIGKMKFRVQYNASKELLLQRLRNVCDSL
jgi:hypothetical protein